MTRPGPPRRQRPRTTAQPGGGAGAHARRPDRAEPAQQARAPGQPVSRQAQPPARGRTAAPPAREKAKAAPQQGRNTANEKKTARERPSAVGAVVVAVAVLLAGAPVSAVVQGSAWFAHTAPAVVVVAVMGIVLARFSPAVTVLGQLTGLLLLITGLFGDGALLGVVPTPAALGHFGTLVEGAGQQIDTGTAPVAATPEIHFLLAIAFGLLAVGVHAAAVIANSPAAAGVPLLALFAVPAALADQLLPWWTMTAAAAGFGLLLTAAGGLRGRLGGGAALVGGAVALALLVGVATPFVGTAGRFAGGGGAGGNGAIGLTPFTALRGQLDQASPTELFEVDGLPRPAYFRALTLRQYVPDQGWQATRPAPGMPLPAAVQAQPSVPGDFADLEISNQAYQDYWLPIYGEPIDISGLSAGEYQYDAASGTAYSGRPRGQGSWHQVGVLPAPSMQDLRGSLGIDGVGLEYLDTAGVDPRVAEIAWSVVGGAGPGFDRAFALQNYFAGPGTQFTYSLQTAPGGGDDALVEFLTNGRTGYCEQFASAMAVMLRTVGVPARVAIGFTAGTDNGDGSRTISTSDAHAWVEAWFPRIGWTIFDPTPLTDGRAIDPPYIQEARAELEAAGGGDTTPGLGPELSPEDLPSSDQRESEGDQPESGPELPEEQALAEENRPNVPVWPFPAAAAAVGLVLAPSALRKRERSRRFAALAEGGPGAADAGWAELMAEATDRGADVTGTDTVRATARRLVREHHLDPGTQQALREIVGAVEASWYGERHPQPRQLNDPVRTVAAGIAAGTALTWQGKLLPRSLVREAHKRLARGHTDKPAP